MNDALRFSQQVDQALAGRLPRHAVLFLGNTPPIYTALGLPSQKLVMNQGTLRKVITKHTLTAAIVKCLPALLANPVMIFESATEPKALAVMIDAKDRDGKTIIAIIHISRRHGRHVIHRVASVYGKNNACWFIKQIQEGRMLYADKEKALRWSQSARLRLPGEVTASRRRKIVARTLHKVKEPQRLNPLKKPKKKGSDHAD